MRFMFIPNPAVEREWGWGNGLSNPWQMSVFYSKEWPWEFSFGQTRFCSKARIFFSVRSGRRFASACSQPAEPSLPTSCRPCPGTASAGLQGGRVVWLSLWSPVMEKQALSGKPPPPSTRPQGVGEGDRERCSKDGLSGGLGTWGALEAPTLGVRPLLQGFTGPHSCLPPGSGLGLNSAAATYWLCDLPEQPL